MKGGDKKKGGQRQRRMGKGNKGRREGRKKGDERKAGKEEGRRGLALSFSS